MSIYDIDYDIQTADSLPPDKRIDKDGQIGSMVNWVNATIGTPMQWLNDLFADYRNGTSYAAWNGATTYAFGERVTFKKSVYESLIDGNIGMRPPLQPTKWYLRQLTFIGADERLRYSSSKLIYEYALNHWFGGTFRQPPSTSDIYIRRTGVSPQSFVAGNTENANAVGVTYSTGFVGNTTVFTNYSNYIIRIPTALYPPGGDDEIRQFADLINPIESVYAIEQY